jgi:ergothioneine biosynthesis protein EgtB
MESVQPALEKLQKLETQPLHDRWAGLPAQKDRSRYAQFVSVRQATAALVQPLSAEDCVIQSMPDASPVKWHLAHTSWFFETFILGHHVASYQPFNTSFKVLFNSYYNAVGDRHPRWERGLLSRPGFDEVLAYRQHVDAAMGVLLKADIPAEVDALVELGCHHEQQHQELILTDVKHLLSRNPLKPVYQKQGLQATIQTGALQWLAFEEALHEIGHRGPALGADFAFDNESPRHRVWLDAFEMASQPVTQGDFMAFINDGGYQRPALWLSAGWDAVVAGAWTAPLYWGQADGRWLVFTLRGEVPVDPLAPVCHVSFFEAEAYARWANARLPTEAEWEVAANSANSAPPGPAGVQGLGEVWEWTRSDYAPYPGFQAAEGAVGEYNGKFMSGQYVLRGGSCATPDGHIRLSYRNFFPPQTRWQFSGMRLARDAYRGRDL